LQNAILMVESLYRNHRSSTRSRYITPVCTYNAKWDEDSFEYKHTEICLDFDQKDQLMIEELNNIALLCWEIFGLKGYVRIDFRIDRYCKPWVLEINTNPYLHANMSAFVAAAWKDNVMFDEIVQRIISAI
jgi:D-alanine-D-alanine ligase